jgi:hypothetical protein
MDHLMRGRELRAGQWRACPLLHDLDRKELVLADVHPRVCESGCVAVAPATRGSQKHERRDGDGRGNRQ